MTTPTKKHPIHQIKAITFDLGGVVFTDGTALVSRELARDYSYDPKLIADLLSSPASLDLRAGAISDADFWRHAQNTLPKSYDTRIIKQYWYDAYEPDPDIFALIKQLHQYYRLFVLSGNIKSRVDYLEKKYKFGHYFDLQIYSYDYRLNKPDPAFTKILIAQAKIPAENIVYIDNDSRAIATADQLGLKAIRYKTDQIAQLLDSLRYLGITI